MSREVTQKTSQDLLTELKGLVAIKKLTAYNRITKQYLKVATVIPNDVESFLTFLKDNHEKIFADYKALDNKENQSYEKSLYARTLKACGYYFAISIPSANADELVDTIKGFAESHREEFSNISRYSRQVSGVSISLQRKSQLFEQIDKTKNYTKNYKFDTLSQIIREARFVLNNTPESLRVHSIYQQARNIDELAQQSQHRSVKAAYKAVMLIEDTSGPGDFGDFYEYLIEGLDVNNPNFIESLKAKILTLNQDAEKELAQLYPSDLGQGPPGRAQGPPGSSGPPKKGSENTERNKQQTLTEQ